MRGQHVRQVMVGVVALLLGVSPCEGEPSAGSSDASVDAPAVLPDAGACTPGCSALMPGEYRVECATLAGGTCADSWALCDRDGVPDAGGGTVWFAPQCVADATGLRTPYCGTTSAGEPGFTDPAVLRCVGP